MNVIVVYESVYGNTHSVAAMIAEGLDHARLLPVREAATYTEPIDLLVVGGPTHMHGLATNRSRRDAAEGAREDGGAPLDPDADAEPGLRAYLADLDARAVRCAAAFDTRLDKSPWVTGVAAHGIARRLRRHGVEVIATESFLVESSEGPLAAGELDRARAWGAELRAKLAEHAVASA